MNGLRRSLPTAEASCVDICLTDPGIRVSAGRVRDVKDEETIRGEKAQDGGAWARASQSTRKKPRGSAEETMVVTVGASDCAGEAGGVGIASRKDVVGETERT